MSNDTAVKKDFTYLYTYTGRKFDVAAPDVREVDIRDIAHALSLLCRYGGHASKFYSVAEHSVHMSNLVPSKDALAALLHDATEAYVVDVPRGVKNALGRAYKNLEDGVWAVIATKFDLAPNLPPSVKYYDNAILLAEKDALIHPDVPEWLVGQGFEKPEITIKGWPPAIAEAAFMRRFKQLTEGK